MKPEDRKQLLRQAKLTESLMKMVQSLDKSRAGGHAAVKQRMEVQVWLNKLPADGLTKLKDLGFDLTATLMPGKLVLGTVDVSKLDALIQLDWVRRIDQPKYR